MTGAAVICYLFLGLVGNNLFVGVESSLMWYQVKYFY